MKKTVYILTGVLLAALVCSCTKPEADYVNVDKETLEFSSAGGSLTVTVSSNVEWAMKTSQSWIKPKRNSENGTIEVKVSSNTADDSREGALVLSGGTVSTKIVIKQNQCNKVVIDGESSFLLTEGDTTITVKFKSNVDYTVSVPGQAASWLSVSDPTKTLSSSEVSLRVAENTAYQTRSAEVSISAPDVSAIKVIVTQMGMPRTFSFSVEGVSSYMLPSIMNSSSPATISDGATTVAFVPGTTVAVSGATTYQVEAYRLENLTFTSAIGLTEVDFSALK